MVVPSHPRAIEVTALASGNAGDRRYYTRYPLTLAGELTVGEERKPCQMHDFSGTGMSVSPGGQDGGQSGPTQDELLKLLKAQAMDLLFTLPSLNKRVRARALIKRITQHNGAPRLGVSFAGANPDVFEMLVQVSDRSRLADLSKCELDQRPATVLSHATGWEALSRYLGNVLDTCFHRCQERMHLKAQYSELNANASQWYFALVVLKAAEQTLRNSFVRELVDSAYSACLNDVICDTLDGMDLNGKQLSDAGEKLRRKLRTEMLEGIDDRALLALLAQRNKPMSQWITARQAPPINPTTLFQTFKTACEATGLQGETRDLLYRTFREAIALHWPFTRRLIEAWLRAEQPGVGAVSAKA